MNKRFSSLAVFVVLSFCAVTAHAEEEYQTEISASYLRADSSSDFRLTEIGASAEIFFAPVKTDGHPYAEAAFLDRVGSVIVMASDIDLKTSVPYANGQSFHAGVNFARPDFPLAIQASYGRTKYDYDAPFNFTFKGSDYSISIGNYLTHSLLAGVRYANSKTDESTMGISFKSTDYGLFAHYVNELGQGNALSLDGSLSTSTFDDGTESLRNTNERILVDYYFSRGLSAGLGIGNSSGKDLSGEGRDYAAKVRYFFSPRFSVSAIYDKFLNANAGYDDSKSFTIAMALRF